jgi:hypothetical protein
MSSSSSNVGVYGYYKNTVFSILATPVGGHAQLTDGVSMLSTLSSSYECLDRYLFVHILDFTVILLSQFCAFYGSFRIIRIVIFKFVFFL